MAGNFAKRVGDTLEAMFGAKKSEPAGFVGGREQTGKQSNLEKIGFAMRKDHLLRNEWKRDIEYTKQLVVAEYLIQNEFKVGDDLEQVRNELEVSEKKVQDKKTNKLNKLLEKRKKIDDKIEKLDVRQPVEIIK